MSGLTVDTCVKESSDRHDNKAFDTSQLTYISLAPIFWDLDKLYRPRSDAASDQGLHCLLTGISIRN